VEELSSTGPADGRRESSLRELGWLGTGALIALGVSLIDGSKGEARAPVLAPPGAVEVWAVDRDGQELCGLDADLVLARSVRLGSPLAVRSCRGGGAWVLRASSGTAAGPRRLARIGADGSIAAEIELGACAAFAPLDQGGVLVVERGTGSGIADRLLRCDENGGREIVFEAAGISCVIASRAGLLAGTSRGEILRSGSVSPDAAVERATLAGAIVDLAPGPTAGSAWVLFGERGSTLGLLGSELALLWSTPTGLRSAHVAPVEGEERVWIADVERPTVRRFGPAGALELDRSDLPLPGLDRVVAWTKGGALLVSPGAILRVDRRGRMMPGQGGFDDLKDLARAPSMPR
jgi:hypothetical protein